MIHSCPECSLVHDHLAPPAEAPDVAIARIQAQSAEAIARINARSERDWNESRETIAETEADAIVESAAVEAEVIGAAIEAGAVADESAEPVIIDAGPPPEDDVDVDAEELPPAEGSPAPAAPRSKRLGLGAW